MTKAAFFDLDKTLIEGSSGLHFARAAHEADLVGWRQMAKWGLDHVRYRLRGSTDDETDRFVAEVEEVLNGVTVTQIERLFPSIIAGVLSELYPPMLERLHAHQDEGDLTFIISAAGHELVAMLSGILRMTGGVGTRYEVAEDGINLTGKIEPPFIYGEGKAAAIVGLAAEHGIDLGASTAYSDSVSDLPMLRTVGNPVVVNPDAELAGVALEEGWELVKLEKLGRQLATAGAVSGAAAVAGGASIAARKMRKR